MKVAYVASPFKSIMEEKGYEEAIALAMKRSKVAFEKGYIPLSPVLTFRGVFSTAMDRDEILLHCFALMKKCDIFIFNESDLEISDGVVKEFNEWKRSKKPYFVIADVSGMAYNDIFIPPTFREDTRR